MNEREKADRKWAERFDEELLIAALDNTPANRRITLHQLGLEEEDVIIREHNGIYFYFRKLVCQKDLTNVNEMVVG